MNRRLILLLVIAALPALAGCRQQMAAQPVGRPFGAPGVARPLVAGTVPRGALADTYEVRTGRKPGTEPDAFSADVFVEKVPLEVTDELLERGRERFNIYCAVCHGRLGDGNGKIPSRGFTKPPSFPDDFSR